MENKKVFKALIQNSNICVNINYFYAHYLYISYKINCESEVLNIINEVERLSGLKLLKIKQF